MLMKTQVFWFVCGLLVGFYAYKWHYQSQPQSKKFKIVPLKSKHVQEQKHEEHPLYNETLADVLFQKVRIVCLIITMPGNHKKRARYIKETWGRKCTKLIFMSTAYDPELDPVILHINETRKLLWGKTKIALQYAYQKYLNEGDFFMKADDDSYIFMENLRHMLFQYNPDDSLYFGHRFTKPGYPHGYMAGGAYLLSRKALSNFVEKSLKTCETQEEGAEDYLMGKCLKNHTIFVDGRDESRQKRFFPASVEHHLSKGRIMTYWYYSDMYYDAVQGSLGCCSDTIAQIHYVGPKEMFMFEYLVYRVHPFGLEKNLTETLPHRLSMEKILSRSNDDSPNRKIFEAALKKQTAKP